MNYFNSLNYENILAVDIYHFEVTLMGRDY